MPDTGAPWNIPYVAGTDLVADWPTDNQALAQAIADGLDVGIGTNVAYAIQDDVVTLSSVAAGAAVDITGLEVTITPSSATSKILVFTAVCGSDNNNSVAGVSVRITRDGTYISQPAGSLGNRISANFGIYNNSATTADIETVNGFLLDSPATTSAVTYKTQAVNVQNSAKTVYINRTSDDVDDQYRQRTVSTLIAIEVAA